MEIANGSQHVIVIIIMQDSSDTVTVPVEVYMHLYHGM
jgi:hypothetical protein